MVHLQEAIINGKQHLQSFPMMQASVMSCRRVLPPLSSILILISGKSDLQEDAAPASQVSGKTMLKTRRIAARR